MSTCFEIRFSTGSYPVSIQSGIFDATLNEHRSDIVLADEWFAPILASAGVNAITLPASESTKSLDGMSRIIMEFRRAGATRQTRLLAIGGGTIQDVAGFVASVYMRGVRWTYIPTTLLAMSDSCIGGKSSINVGPYKNLVGTFHPPSAVVIDPVLVSSLSTEQRVSGLIEACKICYCRGAEVFQEYLGLKPSSAMTAEQTERVLLLSLSSKKWFIEVDEFDRKERLLLNFGHTFGHAIEGASHFRITHGVGVGVGMLCALKLGELMGTNYDKNSRAHTLSKHTHALLGEVPSLPDELATLSIPDVLDRFAADKKHGPEKYSVIVVTRSGDVELQRIPKNGAFVQFIETAIKHIVGLYNT